MRRMPSVLSHRSPRLFPFLTRALVPPSIFFTYAIGTATGERSCRKIREESAGGAETQVVNKRTMDGCTYYDLPFSSSFFFFVYRIID